jgi:hypothetical protein
MEPFGFYKKAKSLIFYKLTSLHSNKAKLIVVIKLRTSNVSFLILLQSQENLGDLFGKHSY